MGLVDPKLKEQITSLGASLREVADFGVVPSQIMNPTNSSITRSVWGGAQTVRAAMSRRQLHMLRFTEYDQIIFVSHQMYFGKNIDSRLQDFAASSSSAQFLFLEQRKAPVFAGLFAVKPSCQAYDAMWTMVRGHVESGGHGTRGWSDDTSFAVTANHDGSSNYQVWNWGFRDSLGASGAAYAHFALGLPESAATHNGNFNLSSMCEVKGRADTVLNSWGLVYFRLESAHHMRGPWTMPFDEPEKHIKNALRWSVRHWWELHRSVEAHLVQRETGVSTSLFQDSPNTATERLDRKIFGVGLSKTATTSLCAALRRMGYRSIHYDRSFVPHLHFWTPQDSTGSNSCDAEDAALAQYERPDCRDLKRETGPGTNLPDYAFDHHYDDWDAVCDLPTAFFYPQLLEAYPNALFVLTERSEQSWLRSFQKHSRRFHHRWGGAMPFRQRCLHDLVYGSHHDSNATLWLEKFRHHNAEVKRIIPRDQLLVMNVVDDSDGYTKLCHFLNRTDGPCEVRPLMLRRKRALMFRSPTDLVYFPLCVCCRLGPSLENRNCFPRRMLRSSSWSKRRPHGEKTRSQFSHWSVAINTVKCRVNSDSGCKIIQRLPPTWPTIDGRPSWPRTVHHFSVLPGSSCWTTRRRHFGCST